MKYSTKRVGAIQRSLAAADLNTWMSFAKSKSIVIALLVTALVACKQDGQIKISKIVVLSPEFQLVNEIAGEDELAHLQLTWNSLDKIPTSSLFGLSQDFTWYKLDIDASPPSRSNRWLYDPRGYLMILAMKKSG